MDVREGQLLPNTPCPPLRRPFPKNRPRWSRSTFPATQVTPQHSEKPTQTK